jgi:hypothetical protein
MPARGSLVAADPAGSAGGTVSSVRGSLPKRRCRTVAIVAVLVLLAVFSIVSIVLSSEDPQGTSNPRDNPLFWTTIGRH